MRNISYLNNEESIKKGKLIYKQDFLDKIDFYVFFLVFFISIFMIVNLIRSTDFNKPNDSFFSYLFLLFPLVSFYLLVRKIFEERLKIIKTKNSLELNREKVLEYINKRKLELYRNNGKCIIFNESHDSFGHCTTTILFFKGELVYYTTIKDGFKLNVPNTLTHIFIKNGLKKILTKSV